MRVHLHTRVLTRLRHDHTFRQDEARTGERATRIAIAVTAAMMVVEVGAGIAFGSMALLADGLHMASHAAALCIAAFAYAYARGHAADQRYSFGTGKVNSLAGFSSALVLAHFALFMAWESVARLFRPIAIEFNQAIAVAVLGLLVNAICLHLLNPRSHEHGDDHHQADHNLRSAYLHVAADALTSVLAIAALLLGKYFGAAWLDPSMGLVGAVLVARWSIALILESGAVLLDRQAPESLRRSITDTIESQDDNRIADLHVWMIAPGTYAAEIALVTHQPRSPDHYKDLLAKEERLGHVTVEVHRCPGEPEPARAGCD
jgi:cation diffusion facilitator family transporter